MVATYSLRQQVRTPRVRVMMNIHKASFFLGLSTLPGPLTPFYTNIATLPGGECVDAIAFDTSADDADG